MKKKILCVMMIAMMIPIVSMAKFGGINYYVSTTGDNANNGSLANPWKDINYAVNTAIVTSGDTIYVAAGTYKEQITITKGLALIGDTATPDNVVIDGENKTLTVNGQVYFNNPTAATVFKGFKIINSGAKAASDHFGILAKGSFSLAIENCKIIGQGSGVDIGCDYGLWSYNRTGDLIIKDCYWNNMYHAILLEMQKGASNIENNVFDTLYTGEYGGSVYGGRAIEEIVYSKTTITSLQRIYGNQFVNFKSTPVQISGGFATVTTGIFTNVLIANNNFDLIATDIINFNGAIYLVNPYGNDPSGGVAANIYGNYIHAPSGNGIQISGYNRAINCNSNTIVGNGIYGIKADLSTGSAINAVYNWWGSNSGPAPTGSGDTVSTNVIYEPWSTANVAGSSETVTAATTIINFTESAMDFDFGSGSIGSGGDIFVGLSYSYPTGDTPGADFSSANALRKVWVITSNLTGFTTDLVFYYEDADIPAGVNEANLMPMRSTDGGLTWQDVTGTVTRDTVANWIKVAGVTGFSMWAFGDNSMVPVELSGFMTE